MICDLLECALCLNERIGPADHSAIALPVNFVRWTHRNCCQRKEGNAPAIFSLQIGYGGLCCIRILRDDGSHTPAERDIYRCEIALRNADEIRDGSRNASAPRLSRLQNNLHPPTEALIAFLDTPLEVETLTDAKEFCIRLPK